MVFCGTPEFAVPSLRAVLAAGHEVLLVVTQPDRAAGRGMALQAPAVKLTAVEKGLRVTQPERIARNAEFRASLEALRERVTGVTTMQLESGLDTGPMLLAREVPVPHTAMASEMFPLLAEVGAELLVETLRGLEEKTVHAVLQDHTRATLAPMLSREDGRIDFRREATEICNRWRGFYPWPGAYATFRGKKFIVHRMTLATMEALEEPLEMTREGELVGAGERLLVVCGEMTALELTEVQLEGKARMMAAEFLRGYQLKGGEQLG